MRIEHAIHISAPRSVVWAVTEDVERWPEWTPTVETVRRLDDGAFGVGSSARIKQPGLPEAVWTVTELIREERFTWTTRVRGIRMRATHELSASGSDGGTRCLLRLEMSGLVAIVLAPFLRRSARAALERENAGLKARCEG